ncbi:MAG: glycosyltransferase [Gemmatimonadales bacterium]|jgi:spore maturation protein CgeB
MKLVVFGLSISSSWGNGHATLWRGLVDALCALGHRVVFFERDLPYYAAHRDLSELPAGRLVLYPDWESVVDFARRELADADVAVVTSYCPDGVSAGELVLGCSGVARVFYDLDTPVTLTRLACGDPVPYLGVRGLADYDLVLSYTGGTALTALRERLGARRVLPLYGSVDPRVHHPMDQVNRFRSDLSYLGTYSSDRQHGVLELFVEPARRRPNARFVMGGAQYPHDFPWTENIHFVRHLPPAEHPAFYSSSRLTLNVTREPMAAFGYCPSGRMFEAAACGTPVVTDCWEGLDEFFAPGEELVTVSNTDDVLRAMKLSDTELGRIGRAARERVLADHTSSRRGAQLVEILEGALSVGA